MAALELLGHYEVAETANGAARSGFALLIELSERRLLLETDVPLEFGTALSLNFFLPDSGSDAGRTKVSLECEVGQCRDSQRLHYSARISRIADPARRAIQKLHAELGSGGRA